MQRCPRHLADLVPLVWFLCLQRILFFELINVIMKWKFALLPWINRCRLFDSETMLGKQKTGFQEVDVGVWEVEIDI